MTERTTIVKVRPVEEPVRVDLRQLAVSCGLRVSTGEAAISVLPEFATHHPTKLKEEIMKTGMLEERATYIVEWLRTL